MSVYTIGSSIGVESKAERRVSVSRAVIVDKYNNMLPAS